MDARSRLGKAARRGALIRALALVLFGGTALVTLHVWFGLGGHVLDYAVEGPIYDSVVIAAGLACLARARGAGNERGAWLAIGAATLCWGASEVYWTAFILNNPSPPYPSPADAGYLAFYPLAALGVALLVRAHAHELEWRLWFDGLIAALGTAALGAAFVFDFIANRTSGSAVQVATTLAYPLGDITMLALVIGVIALTGWRGGPTWTLLLAGLLALVIADVTYTLGATGVDLPGGAFTDPIYAAAAACLGAALWLPSAARIRVSAGSAGWRELIVPALFAAILIGLFTLQSFHAASGFSRALWVAAMIAVIARLAISVRENGILLERARTDALTGLANRGAMQVDLEAACARAGEEALTLVLFDLDGFKHLNDAFGHPAGDQILIERGDELVAALGEDGTAYRFGGDEFCVLLGCAEDRLDDVKRRAASALTTRGRGYEISASWGAVRIPAEASEPGEALALADMRMYAQKESRGVARGDRLPQEEAAPAADRGARNLSPAPR